MTLFSQLPLLPFFDVRETFIAADTGGGLILREDWRRIGILWQNVGANDVFIRPNLAASVGQGLLLTARAAPLELKFRDWGSLLVRDWFAIADIMNSDMVIYETLYAPLEQK